MCLTASVDASQTTYLNIIVVDQNKSFISPVTARLKKEDTVFKEIKSAESQEISFLKLEAGKYILEIEAEGFKPYSQEIEIKTGKNEITIELKVAEIVENVEVERSNQEKATDAREGAFSNFLTIEQLEALPEDPEEIKKVLKDQFGQDAVFKVDGFSSSRLPPKSQIASIRITRSSFDAEYHQIGATFIDIITKAGGGKWTGSVSFNFNDESLNARNPFALERYPTQQRNFEAFILGPIIKNKTSLFLTLFGENSYRQENIVAVLPNGRVENSTSGFYNSIYRGLKFRIISVRTKL